MRFFHIISVKQFIKEYLYLKIVFLKKPTKHTSALQERDGVLQPPSINPNFSNKAKTIGHDKFIQEITNGNTVFLSKAITLIESVHPKHKEKANAILQGCIR